MVQITVCINYFFLLISFCIFVLFLIEIFHICKRPGGNICLMFFDKSPVQTTETITFNVQYRTTVTLQFHSYLVDSSHVELVLCSKHCDF